MHVKHLHYYVCFPPSACKYVSTCTSVFNVFGHSVQILYCKFISLSLSVCVCACVVSGSRLLQPAHVCDILKALILVLSFSMTHYLDYSMMYHLIRGQSVIKLYIIYNMLEVTNMEFGCKVTACIACNCIQSVFGVSIFVYSSLDLNTHKISLTSGICHEAFIT